MPVMELLAKKPAWLWCVAVGVAVFLVYAPTLGHDFSLMDDAYFVTENPVVTGGLTVAGMKAAFTGVYASYWAPLLWLSLMTDHTIAGGAPWSFHLTNGVLFALSAGLLFMLVRRWTGQNGVALAAALLWALHPVRVESVAWITERKDVLSGVFFLAGLWFYTLGREAKIPATPQRKPSKSAPAGRGGADSIRRRRSAACIVLSWLCMLLGGMAKPSVLVMPAALMLLDVWPLERTTWTRLGRDVWRLMAEKWAFWLLAIGYAGLTALLQSGEQAILAVPWSHRLATMPIHYLFYLRNMVWPTALAPLQGDLPVVTWQLVIGLGLLASATVPAWRFRIRAPWVLWGWLWFVGLLLPYSGLIWVGSESVALRWLYLPHIGLALVLARALGALARARPGFSLPVRGLLMALLIVCSGVTLRTLSNWRDPNAFGLWIYECHPDQGGACAMGGDTYMAGGAWDLALAAYEKGVALRDRNCFVRQCMVWNQLGYPERTAQAWPEFEKQLGHSLLLFAHWERGVERELFWRVHGQALLAQRDYPAAIAALQEACQWEPDPQGFAVVEFIRACHEGGQPTRAAAAVTRMAAAGGLRVHEWKDLLPFHTEIWKTGARGYAYRFFADFAERFPDDSIPLAYLAWLLATAAPDGLDHAHHDEWPQTARRWAEQALEKTPDPTTEIWLTVAAARANAGHFSDAVPAAEKALAMANENRDTELAEVIAKQIMNYRLGLAWRE